MPGKRPRVERLLEVALDALAKALGESRAPWMIIGGIAIIARGVRRFTTDIDATVRGDAIGPKALLTLFERHGITPRIEDAVPFAEENLVLLLRHEPTGVDLDVSFAWSAFEHAALAARAPISLPAERRRESGPTGARPRFPRTMPGVCSRIGALAHLIFRENGLPAANRLSL